MYTSEECCEYIKKLNNEYKEKHIKKQERDELVSENNIEKRDIKGYHGREILELLQNADDAYQKSINSGLNPKEELEVTIKYIDNILTISNTGTFFDNDGIKAIVQGNNSSKKGKYIGCKGTGFRSILNWANSIKIFSGNFKIEFSQEIASSFFNEIKNEKQIQKQLTSHPDLYVPMLSVPRYITSENTKNNADETTIEISIDPSKINDDFNVEKQISNIDDKILLFLPNTSSIHIITKSDDVVFKRERVNNDIIKYNDYEEGISSVLLKKCDKNNESKKEYDLFERTIRNKIEEDGEFKDINIAVAVPKFVMENENLHLYTFFPLLETRSPFNCIMHATYDLSDQRNTINKSENNKIIILEQIKFLIDIVCNYYVKNKKYKEAMKLITPSNIANYDSWSFSSGFDSFKLENDFLDLLKDVKLFQTVNEELLSISDQPKMLDRDFPNFFKGINFRELLKPIEDESIKIFIKLLAKYYKTNLDIYELNLENKISNSSNEWTIEQQVSCFDWWCNNYNNHLPKLLKNQEGNWLKYKEECFFLDGDFLGIDIPLWVKVPALDSQYQKCLFEIAKRNKRVIEIKNNDLSTPIPISRIVSKNEIYKLVNFRYSDRSNIIVTINACVDSYDKAVEFVKWLWRAYSNDESWTPQDIKYNFPSKNKKVINSSLLYFSDDYGNSLSKHLFLEGYEEFPSFNSFNVKIEERYLFEKFVSKFGVCNYPKIELMEVSNPLISYQNYIQSFIKDHKYLGSSTSFQKIKYELLYIKNLDKILNSLSTQEIIMWINNDNNLHSNLQTSNTRDNKIVYQGNLQKSLYFIQDNFKNYILYVFNNTKWIEIKGKKYSPKEIIYDNYSRSNQKFAELVPVITRDDLKEMTETLQLQLDDVINIFELFQLCENVTDLDSNSFYDVLLKIPNCDKKQSIEMSRAIYRIVEQKDFNRKYEDSVNKAKFFIEGKVLTQKHDYVLAKDVYLPSTLIINKGNYNILDKGIRKGDSQNFIEIFGCKEFKKKIEIIKSSIVYSKDDIEFQKYFIEYKKYAVAYNGSNSNIKKYLNNLSINLVEKINIKVDDVEEGIKDNYTEIRDSSTKWYIYLNEKLDYRQLSICIENIFTNIANTPGFDAGKYGELFRTKNEEDRKFLIRKEFGSCEFINENNYVLELKNSFVKAVKTVNSDINVEEYNIDFYGINTFNSISKIVKLMEDARIDSVKVLYEFGFDCELDFTEFYQIQIGNFVSKEKINYKNFLFAEALSNEDKQREFLKNYYKFENFKLLDKISDVINIKDFVSNQFGNWENSVDTRDAEKEYSNNYHTLNPENVFSDEIETSYEAQTMIYFNKKDNFNEWLKQKSKQLEKDKIRNSNPYEKFIDKIPIKQNIKYSTNLINTSSNIHLNTSTNKYVYNESNESKKRSAQKVLGNKGELLVYNLLCKEYGKDNVFPKSEAFKDLGIREAGLCVSREYDIEYKDTKTNEQYYVEVKSGDKNSFYISPQELNFAKNHPNNYKLYIVYDLDKDDPVCSMIDSQFWNDERYKKEEIVEKIYVTF